MNIKDINIKKYITKKNVGIIVALLVLLFVVSVFNKNKAPLTDGQIITNLSRLTAIPDINSDIPQIYRIDFSQPQQPFFNGAQEGDLAILFLKSQKAYVYSPSRNMVINSGPIEKTEEKKSVEAKPAVTSTSTGAKASNSSER